MAVLRADMCAFFLTGGILAAAAAWRQNAGFLFAPILLFAIVPMAVEAFFVVSLLFAHRTFAASRSNG